MLSCGRAVTASIGSACFIIPPASAGIALATVDGLMFEAKAAGKNLIVHRNLSLDPVRRVVAAA
jgi:hypothetical protein